MAKAKKYPALFTHILSDEGTKEDAVKFMQTLWDESMNLESALMGLGFTHPQIRKMEREGKLGKVF